ncbi:hypothetical protein [Nocardiopsis ansamitocini]|uniref:Uncharacterized protein n=1 Tax=Nocardiopsis ansamitocini TaxID=1670832 RepID=A0A9W6UIX7_9ACTN|nr:hypothetical protein [Nocardiopsis ansamitocini]GLU48152.1 hypothetical protein Nans01_25030 [Nocardiopsis ansamitocini]
MAGTVLSHWLPDLLAHRPAIAILPSDTGDLLLIVLGLGETPAAAALVDGLLVFVGAALYTRRTMRDQPYRTGALLYSLSVSLLLGGFFTSDLLG